MAGAMLYLQGAYTFYIIEGRYQVMAKKLIICVLILALLSSLFAGCMSKPEEDTKTPTPTQQPVSDTPTPEDDLGVEQSETSYPIAEPGTIELTYWFPLFSFVTAHITDMNDNPIFVEMEKITGIHINWLHPPQESIGEQFNLLFVSGDLPDMFKDQGYPSGPDQAIKDGYYARLNDYIDKYAPNYKSLLENTEVYRLAATTDEGNIWGFGYFRAENARVVGGLGYRRDVFEAEGIDGTKLEFISDWDNTFATLKDRGYSQFLQLDNNGLSGSAVLLSAWETAAVFQNRDGTVVFGPATNEFKEYLKKMAEWYDKGYMLDTISYTNPANFLGRWVTGETLVGTILDGFTGTQCYDSGQTDIEGFYLAAAHYPRLNENTKIHNWHGGGGYQMSTTSISADSDNIEAAVRWCDYFFSDDGFMIVNYGIEGKTYDYDENDRPMLSRYMTHNENGLGVIFMMFINCFMGGIGIESTAPRFDLDPATDYETKVFTESVFGSDWNMPASTTLNAEEASEYSRIYADIETYVQEYTYNCIVGTKDVESTFDEYLARLKQMKLDTAIELQQNALNRFLSR